MMNGIPADGGEEEMDDPELRAKLIAELEQLVRGGQAREMAGRLGRLPPDGGADLALEGSPEEESLESPDQEAAEPIPGVEGEEGADPAASGGPDKDKLRALLASMKSKSTMG